MFIMKKITLALCALLFTSLFFLSCEKETNSSITEGNSLNAPYKDGSSKSTQYGELLVLLSQEPTSYGQSALELYNNILHSKAVRGVYGYYFMPMSDLVREMDKRGVSLPKLVAKHSLSDLRGVVSETSTYKIYVPYLDEHYGVIEMESGSLPPISTQDLKKFDNELPMVSFDTDGGSYPIYGGKYDKYTNSYSEVKIKKAMAQYQLLNLIAIAIVDECLIDGPTCSDVISPCIASGMMKSDCDDDTPILIDENPSSDAFSNCWVNATGHHEIGLNLWKNFTGGDHQYYEQIVNEWGQSQSAFARLEALKNYQYYEISEGALGSARVISLLDDAITYDESESGRIINLCDCENLLTQPGSDQSTSTNKPIWVGHGGVYKLTQIGMPPLYFSFPFGKGLWFEDGPDMNFAYIFDLASGYEDCTTFGTVGQKDVDPVLWLMKIPMLEHLDLVGEEASVLFSHDLSEIAGYWEKNAITVYLLEADGQMVTEGNVFEVTTDDGPFNTLPPPSIGIQVGSLEKVGNGQFEVSDQMTGNLVEGQDVIVHITAQFEGEPLINHYIETQVQSNGGGDLMQQLRATIRGDKRLVEYSVKIHRYLPE